MVYILLYASDTFENLFQVLDIEEPFSGNAIEYEL